MTCCGLCHKLIKGDEDLCKDCQKEVAVVAAAANLPVFGAAQMLLENRLAIQAGHVN